MTREEAVDYRRACPYDAMGDFSVFEHTAVKPQITEQKSSGTKRDKQQA